MAELTEPKAEREPSEADLAAVVGEVWREILGYDSFDHDTGFFDAGGDSLLLLALVAKLSEVFGTQLKTLSVYQAATINGQAGLLRSLRQGRSGASAADA